MVVLADGLALTSTQHGRHIGSIIAVAPLDVGLACTLRIFMLYLSLRAVVDIPILIE